MGGGDVPDDGAGEEANLNILTLKGNKRISVRVNLNSTVTDFKSIIAEKCAIPPHMQRLFYKGRLLKDDQTLKSNGLEADGNVLLVSVPATTDAGIRSTNSKSTNADSGQSFPKAGKSFPKSGQSFPKSGKSFKKGGRLQGYADSGQSLSKSDVLAIVRDVSSYLRSVASDESFAAEAGSENMIKSPTPNTKPLPNPWVRKDLESLFDISNLGSLPNHKPLNLSLPKPVTSAALASLPHEELNDAQPSHPEELYATELSQLREMGFLDTEQNIEALMESSGDVRAAVERLLRLK